MEKEELNYVDETPQMPEEVSDNVEDILLGDDMQEDPQSGSKDQEVQELKDKYLRLLAEFENYKKRTTKERIDFARYASQELIVSLLPIMDDFDRALKHGQATEGSQLIHNKLITLLKQKSVTEMISTGELFDASLHEAITEVSVSEDQKNKIIDTVEKGYYISDKIIRYAKVVVGK